MIQKDEKKLFEVKIHHNGAQFVLEIMNFCKEKVIISEDGLPKKYYKGYGIGMLSLRRFIKKYEAYADF